MKNSLNLIGKPDNPPKFLIVWWNDNSEEYYCSFIHDKDYETAEYAVLQILPKTGINNAVLYKSAVKINNTNKQHVFRVYTPIAFYSGDKYKLTKVKDCVMTPIEIWRNEKSHWQAEFIKILSLEWDEMKTAIYTNFDRVYGRNK
jgi:hypothetical protein